MIANTKNQNLYEHSFLIGELAVLLFKKIDFNEKIDKIIQNKINFIEIIRFSGYLHDLGKIDPVFQKILVNSKEKEKKIFDTEDGTHVQDNKITLEEYIRHNELSYVLIHQSINEKNEYFIKLFGNYYAKNLIAYVGYWHHAKIFRKQELNTIDIISRFKKENPNINLKKEIDDFFNAINEKYNEYFQKTENFHNFINNELYGQENLPSFKERYKSINNNWNDAFEIEAKKSLLRSIIVTADRIISNLDEKDLKKYIEKKDGYQLENLIPQNVKIQNQLINEINEMEIDFEEQAELENNLSNKNRNFRQKEIVDQLSQYKSPVVLSGPAGCGKTKIFLQWIKKKEIKENQQVFIICPRNMICKGLFDELTSKYLPKTKIEIYTGEYQLKSINNKIEEIEENQHFSSSIIITTFDQIINIILSHKKIDSLMQIINSFLIIDEFHEFFNLPGIIFLLKEILLLKQSLKESNTLLVSATPNNHLTNKFLDCPIIKMETFNHQRYIFKYKEVDDINCLYTSPMNNVDILEDIKKEKEGSIIIYNTAISSQISSLYNKKTRKENNINYHSKFTIADKQKISKDIMKFWKKEFKTNKILRSGPIVQASLNISTHLMLSEITCAENWCQRLGRVNRFATENIIGQFITISENNLVEEETEKNSFIKTLNHLNMMEQTIAWNYFLKEKLKNNNIQFLKEIYNLYDEFHKLESTQKAYDVDFEKIIQESENLFNKNNSFEPYQIKSKKDKTKNKLSKRSIRGNNLYILPRKLILDTNEESWLYIPKNIDNNLGEENNSISIEKNGISFNPNEILQLAEQQSSFIKDKSINENEKPLKYEQKLLKYLNGQIVLRKALEIENPLIVSYPKADKGLIYLIYKDLIIGLIKLEKLKSIDIENFFNKIIEEKDIEFLKGN